jgi:creatinine amidohydrolase/Fe(II)-dependent formamide hydrolase-like protein
MKKPGKASAPAKGGRARAAGDPLLVIDRLEVGPIKVEPRRVTAPYTVVRAGVTETTNLIYRFEEDVFDASPASHNLAAMMTAQVALNYGLFCERLVFRGNYDPSDMKFIRNFTEHTAREIYVNKFLMPNEFLVGAAGELQPRRKERYSRAAIEFEAGNHPDTDPGRPDAARSGEWATDPYRHAVLSSGGKDSLVTYGVLGELGLEAHPVFVNESGRHWYTALNAYRHLSANDPHTARVWTNADRVFAWMLRHLPFVRRDFSRVRSDEYPIRLWTVAVFVFGALPLLRKRRIGRLLIGDEHDTTVKSTHHGITHFNGLFDQSRYFDEDLTRYFRRKDWGICQFSILRPLSELLVEKVLAERYPDLLRHQVSCHATHIETDTVRPCGRCEKCRRIAGMLMALGADPARCGYPPDVATRCLEDLAAKGVHQEDAGARQLAHMLSEKGLIPDTDSKAFPARHCPETLALRFHPKRSPVEAIPRDLRAGVYGIFLHHAGGALVRSGRLWEEFDPLGEQALAKPYSLERRGTGRRAGEAGGSRRDTDPAGYLLAELTWPEAEARFKQVDVALLPVGAVEQHGPHLPLDTDAFDADYLARRVAAACSTPKPLVFPPINYGVSYHHEEFSGTLSIGPETLARMILEIGICAARCGVTKLLIINGHGGNVPALHLGAQMINRDAHIFTCVETGETSDTDIDEMIETPNDVHAGEIETSTSLAVRPELVKMKQAPRMIPRFSSRFLDFSSKRSVSWYAHTEKISKTGVMGDATKATAEKGERMWDVMTRRLVELVEDLKKLSLDEIHQRRY